MEEVVKSLTKFHEDFMKQYKWAIAVLKINYVSLIYVSGIFLFVACNTEIIIFFTTTLSRNRM